MASMDAPLFPYGKVWVCSNGPAHVQKQYVFGVYLASCIDGEGDLPLAFDLRAHDLYFSPRKQWPRTPSTQSRSPSSSYPALRMIAIRCHRQRAAQTTIAARFPPPPPPSVDFCCAWCVLLLLFLLLLEIHCVVRIGCIREESVFGLTQYRSEKHIKQGWCDHASLAWDLAPHGTCQSTLHHLTTRMLAWHCVIIR